MSITTAKHHKGIPLNGGGGASPASAVPQHSHRGGEHSGPVGPQHASSGRPDKGFLGFDANGGAPMNHIYGYGYGHGRPDPFNDIDHQKLMNGGLSREAATTEAQQLWRENKTINSRGQIVPKGNFSQREINQHAAATAAAHAGKVGMSDDGIKNAFKGDTTPASTPAQGLASTYPVDPSTVRQPVAPVGDGEFAKDSQGNKASDSNPAVGTPAEFRQMSRDAANGRTVKTGGTTGLTPSADGGRPTQAADFRRTITSKYGTGSNVTRQPGQAPGTVTDSMGRTVPAQQWNQDQADVQATKMGPNAKQAGENYFNPASIRQPASTPSAAAPQKAAAPAPASTGPVGMSREDINSAFSPDLPASTRPVGMSSQDIGKAFGSPQTPPTGPATAQGSRSAPTLKI